MATRINKYLAERGVCSRRNADVLIDERRVRINGEIAEKGTIVEEGDEVTVNQKRVSEDRPDFIYKAFHKPVGILTSVDPNGKDTIATFLHLKERLFPVGRLDVASSGLLILTNDGNLSEAITHPRGNHEKEYVVTVHDDISNADLDTMRNGMVILGQMTKPAQIKRVGPRKFHIILTEGKNRQIRRMTEALGFEVKKLVRIRVMNIELGDLEEGAVRPLTRKEITDLKKALIL